MPSLRTHRKGKKETREVWFDHIYWDSHIFWNTSIIQGILAPPLFWTGRPGWFTCPCSWVWSWGRRAPPRRPWSASAGRRGRNLRPWTVLPILLFFNLAQSYLQVLGLDPVDVMAVGALPHHLTSNGTAPSHTIDQTYERTDEGDGAAKDDEEGLDADVVLQWLHVSALRFQLENRFGQTCFEFFTCIPLLFISLPPLPLR